MVKSKGQSEMNIEVAQEHRDLGGHLDFTMMRTGTTLTQIIKIATIYVRETAHLPGPFSNKNKLITTKHLPNALYGAPTAPEHWAVVNRLGSAIADSYDGKGNDVKRHTRSVFSTFYASSPNLSSTADPWYLLFHKRALSF